MWFQDKCRKGKVYMCMCIDRLIQNLRTDSQVIQRCETFKYLGMTFTLNKIFEKHILARVAME